MGVGRHRHSAPRKWLEQIDLTTPTKHITAAASIVRVRGASITRSNDTAVRSGSVGSIARVRGMNAAAANTGGTGSGGGGHDAGPRKFPHASVRQLLVAICLLVVGILIASYTLTEVTGGPASFTGSVESIGSVSLDFSQTGRIAEILVNPGATVTKGQPLATEDQEVSQADLKDAQAILAAKEAILSALKTPTVSQATQSTITAQANAAGTALAGAQTGSRDALNQANTEVNEAQQTLNSAAAVANADATQLRAACPNGVVVPAGLSQVNTPGSTSNVSSLQLAAYQNCVNLSSQYQRDTATANSAVTNLAHTRAMAAQLQDSASSVASTAAAALAIAKQSQALAEQPASAADLASAQADVASAQATVDQDQALLAELTIVAPVSGTVAYVGGLPGELDGTTGVHAYTGPPSLQSSTGPAFSLFPSSTASSAGGNASGGNQQPLISIVSNQNDALAQVSQNTISKLRAGQLARVKINALNDTVDATVSQIVPIPVNQSGTVDYEVRLHVPSWPTGMVPGMTLSVTFP